MTSSEVWVAQDRSHSTPAKPCVEVATVPIVDGERILRETLSVFRQVDGLAARTVELIGEAAPLVPDPPVDVVTANGFLEGRAALELLDCARS